MVSCVLAVSIASALPLVAAAADVSSSTMAQAMSIESQINALLQQVSALKAQLAQLRPTSTSSDDHGASGPELQVVSGTNPLLHLVNGSSTLPGAASNACFGLARNLSRGAHGEDVMNLQRFLAANLGTTSTSGVTGFFGTSTAQAIIQFQKEHGIASSSAGFVGPMTREFLAHHCLPIPGTNASGTPIGPLPPIMMHGDNGTSSRDGKGDDHGPRPLPPFSSSSAPGSFQGGTPPPPMPSSTPAH